MAHIPEVTLMDEPEKSLHALRKAVLKAIRNPSPDEKGHHFK